MDIVQNIVITTQQNCQFIPQEKTSQNIITISNSNLKDLQNKHPNSKENHTKINKNQLKSVVLLASNLSLNITDTVTDFLMFLKLFTAFLHSNLSEDIIAASAMITALLYERRETYFILKQIIITLNQKKKNILQQITRKQQFKIFFHLFTLSEHLLFHKISPFAKKYQKYMIQKKINDLIFENLLFLIIGSSFSFYEYLETQSAPQFTLISTLFSFMSTCYILFLFQLNKFKAYNKYKELNYTELYNYSLDLQLLLTKPDMFPLLKFNGSQNQDLLKQLKNPKHMYKNQQIKVSFLKKLYILSVILIMLLSDIVLLSVNQIYYYRLSISVSICVGAILHSPGIVHHIAILWNNRDKIHDYKKKITIIILKIPLEAAGGACSFILPYITYEIPFLKHTKMTWNYFYYNTLYVVISKFFVQSYCLYSLIYIVNYKQNLLPLIRDNPKIDLNYLSDSSSSFKYLYYTAIGLYTAQVFILILHIIDKLQQKKQTKKNKQYQTNILKTPQKQQQISTIKEENKEIQLSFQKITNPNTIKTEAINTSLHRNSFFSNQKPSPPPQIASIKRKNSKNLSLISLKKQQSSLNYTFNDKTAITESPFQEVEENFNHNQNQDSSVDERANIRSSVFQGQNLRLIDSFQEYPKTLQNLSSQKDILSSQYLFMDKYK